MILETSKRNSRGIPKTSDCRRHPAVGPTGLVPGVGHGCLAVVDEGLQFTVDRRVERWGRLVVGEYLLPQVVGTLGHVEAAFFGPLLERAGVTAMMLGSAVGPGSDPGCHGLCAFFVICRLGVLAAGAHRPRSARRNSGRPAASYRASRCFRFGHWHILRDGPRAPRPLWLLCGHRAARRATAATHPEGNVQCRTRT